MVNPPNIAAPVHRGTAGRSAGTAGAAQSYNYQLFPSEGADQAGNWMELTPSEGADQAFTPPIYGVQVAPSEGADQAYIGYGIPSEGVEL